MLKDAKRVVEKQYSHSDARARGRRLNEALRCSPATTATRVIFLSSQAEGLTAMTAANVLFEMLCVLAQSPALPRPILPALNENDGSGRHPQ